MRIYPTALQVRQLLTESIVCKCYAAVRNVLCFGGVTVAQSSKQHVHTNQDKTTEEVLFTLLSALMLS
jgi:hypothetical protein